LHIFLFCEIYFVRFLGHFSSQPHLYKSSLRLFCFSHSRPFALFSLQLPSELGALSMLAKLNLSYNSLSGVLPPSLCDLKKLKKLMVRAGVEYL